MDFSRRVMGGNVVTPGLQRACQEPRKDSEVGSLAVRYASPYQPQLKGATWKEGAPSAA